MEVRAGNVPNLPMAAENGTRWELHSTSTPIVDQPSHTDITGRSSPRAVFEEHKEEFWQRQCDCPCGVRNGTAARLRVIGSAFIVSFCQPESRTAVVVRAHINSKRGMSSGQGFLAKDEDRLDAGSTSIQGRVNVRCLTRALPACRRLPSSRVRAGISTRG